MSARFGSVSRQGNLRAYGNQCVLCFPKQIYANETLSSEKFWGSATVTVELVNVNDNNPKFEKLLYNFTFNEEVQAGAPIAQITVRFRASSVLIRMFGFFGSAGLIFSAHFPRVNSILHSIHHQCIRFYFFIFYEQYKFCISFVLLRISSLMIKPLDLQFHMETLLVHVEKPVFTYEETPRFHDEA